MEFNELRIREEININTTRGWLIKRVINYEIRKKKNLSFFANIRYCGEKEITVENKNITTATNNSNTTARNEI